MLSWLELAAGRRSSRARGDDTSLRNAMEARRSRPRRSIAAQKIGTARAVLPSDHSGVNRALAVCDLRNAIGGADEKSAARAAAPSPLTPDPHLRSSHAPRSQIST